MDAHASMYGADEGIPIELTADSTVQFGQWSLSLSVVHKDRVVVMVRMLPEPITSLVCPHCGEMVRDGGPDGTA